MSGKFFMVLLMPILIVSFFAIKIASADDISPIPPRPAQEIPTSGNQSIATRSSSGNSKSSSSATFSFGGKVIATNIPGVICTGVGTGPVVLGSNVGGAVNAISSQSSTNSDGQKIVGGVSGVYKTIPFWTTDMKKVPRVGGQILGRAKIIPNFSKCYTDTVIPIPIPVREVTIYNVSKPAGTSGSSNCPNKDWC